MEEKITSTERIYDGHLVKLDLHQVALPMGGTGYREVVVHPGAVAMIPIDGAQHVLLVRQFRLPAGKAVLEIPAGTREPEEEPEQCAIRELQEEIGHKPEIIESLGGIFTAPGYTTEFIHLFYTAGLTEAPLEADADELIEVVRLPFSEALQKIETGEIDDAKTVTGLLRVARKLGI